MSDPLHVPTSNNYRCLDAGASTIFTLLDCVEVTSSGPVTPTHGTPDYLDVLSNTGVVADAEFELPIGEKFTFSITFNASSIPADLSNLESDRFFVGAYNSEGKCMGILVSMQGIALVDTPGASATPIPETNFIQYCIGRDTTLCLTVDENGLATLYYNIDGLSSGVAFVSAAPDSPSGFGNGAVLEFLGQSGTPLHLSLLAVQSDCYRVVTPFYVEYPVAVPGPDRTELLGEPVILDASASYGYRDHPELVDDNLSYDWSLVLAPDGSKFKIYDYGGAPVDDGDGDPFTTIFSALVGSALFSIDNAPLLKPGDTLVLTIPDPAQPKILRSYAYKVSTSRWRQTDTGWERDYTNGWNDDQLVVDKDSIPVGWTNISWAVYHTATFVYEPSAQVTYAAPDVAGLFELQLIVGTSWPTYSAPITLLVNVVPTALALGVVPDVSFIWNYLSNFWSLLEDREKVSTMWSGFAQAAANILLTAWQIDYNKSLKDIQRTFQRRWLSYSFKVADSAPWTMSGVVTSADVNFQAVGIMPDDLATFSVKDLSSSVTVDIHCPVLSVTGYQLTFDLTPLSVRWGGYPDNFTTVFTGVLRTQIIPVDDLVVSIPRLQVVIAAPKEILEEGKDYSVKKVKQNGQEINAIVFRSGTFAAQDPPADSYWAEQTHLDNSPAIDANFGSLVPPLSEKSYKEWKQELPNLDYLSAVQGLWFAYWGGPTIYNMRVGVQILLGLPFAEEKGTVVEVNSDFSTKEGRLLIQDLNGSIVRSYFYPRAVGPATKADGSLINVGDMIEKFSSLCGGIEILDWVNSPGWGNEFSANKTISSLQRYFKFMLRGNADAFDPMHIIFAADFVKHIKPHYTDVMTVLQKSFTDNIDVVDSIATKVKMKIVQSTDPQVRGALRWDDYDGAGVIRHHLDEAPISFVWDHDGLSPRQQVSVLASDVPTDTKVLADLQGLGGSPDEVMVVRALPGSGTLTRVVVVVRVPVRGLVDADYATVDLSASPSTAIAAGVKLSDSQGVGQYVALDLADLSIPCTGNNFVATFHALTFDWDQATSGSVQFYYFIS